jgi:hypothetical protein
MYAVFAISRELSLMYINDDLDKYQAEGCDTRTVGNLELRSSRQPLFTRVRAQTNGIADA